MITELNKEQAKKVPVYLKAGEKIGYRTKTVDKTRAKKAVNFYYEKIMKIKKPKYVVFLDSPMACQLACNLIKNTKLDGKNLDDELDSQLRSQLDSQLRSQLRSQLYSQLGSQLDSQLRSQLGSQLDSQLDSQLRSQKLEYFYMATSNWFGWTGYYVFYNYILNELLPKKKLKFKLFREFYEHFQEIHISYMFPEIVFVSDFPKQINLNAEKQLHSYDQAALLYRDSYSLYMSNGIQMKKEYIETPVDKITKEMFLSEENVDVRREISRKLGIDKTIEMLGAETVDTYDSKVCGKYELLMIDFNNSGQKRPYLKMTNPSLKGVHHIEGVGVECKTVKDAIMFRNSLTKFIEPEALT